MNQTVYQIERNGLTRTVKTMAGAGGAAVGLYPDLRPISWTVLERHIVTNAEKKILVNGCVTVTEIDIPLSWVK